MEAAARARSRVELVWSWAASLLAAPCPATSRTDRDDDNEDSVGRHGWPSRMEPSAGSRGDFFGVPRGVAGRGGAAGRMSSRGGSPGRPLGSWPRLVAAGLAKASRATEVTRGPPSTTTLEPPVGHAVSRLAAPVDPGADWDLVAAVCRVVVEVGADGRV